MTFIDAIKSCISQYATFTGRAPRSEFWWFTLFCFLGTFVITFIFTLIGSLVGPDPLVAGLFPYPVGAVIGVGVAEVVCLFLFFVPSWAVTVRRLHDTGHSGKLLLAAILVGFLDVLNAVIMFYRIFSSVASGGTGLGVATVHGTIAAILGITLLILNVWLFVLMLIGSFDGENKYGLPIY